MARFAKPAFPRLRAGAGLADQLLFALPPGWDRGYGLPGPHVTRSSMTGRPGTAINTLIAGGPATVEGFGWALTSSSDGWFDYVADIGVPTFIAGAAFSCAVLVRPTIVPPLNSTNRRVFQKRVSGAATSPGFDVFLDTFITHTWSFEWSDGVNEQTLRSTTAPSTQRADVIVGTLDPVANQARIYINGVLEREAALAVVPVNPAGRPIGVGGGIGPVGDAGGNAAIGMAALWNRRLSMREAAELAANPYALWEP